MKKELENIKFDLLGDYSEIKTRDYHKLIEVIGENHLVKKNKEKMNYLIPNYYLFDVSKSIYVNKTFIGNITEVHQGFIPDNSLTNFIGYKKYKTFNDCKNFLIQKNFNKVRQLFFGLLARQEFDYSINYLKDLSFNQIVDYMLTQYPNRVTHKQAVKILKKYRKQQVFEYQGQGGYKSKFENVLNS